MAKCIDIRRARRLDCSCLNPLTWISGNLLCCECISLGATTPTTTPSSEEVSTSWEIPSDFPEPDGEITVNGNISLFRSGPSISTENCKVSISSWLDFVEIQPVIPFPLAAVISGNTISVKLKLDKEYCFSLQLPIEDWFSLYFEYGQVELHIKGDAGKVTLDTSVYYRIECLGEEGECIESWLETKLEIFPLEQPAKIIAIGAATARISPIALKLYELGVLTPEELLFPKTIFLRSEYDANFLPDWWYISSFSDLDTKTILEFLDEGGPFVITGKGSSESTYVESAIALSGGFLQRKNLTFLIKGQPSFPTDVWVDWEKTVSKVESSANSETIGAVEILSADVNPCNVDTTEIAVRERTWRIGYTHQVFAAVEKTQKVLRIQPSAAEKTRIDPYLFASEKTLLQSKFEARELTFVFPHVNAPERTVASTVITAKEKVYVVSYFSASEITQKTGAISAAEKTQIEPYLSAVEKTEKQHWFVAKERTTKINWWIDDLPEYYRYYGIIVEN